MGLPTVIPVSYTHLDVYKRQVKEESIVIETSADRVRIEFAKWAISTKGAQTTETTK